VQGCVTDLQQNFGPRIERILGTKGGLLVVLDRVEENDDKYAAALSERIPVALVDRHALQGLQRLGVASPAADAETLYDSPQLADTSPLDAANPLARKARQKLEAAEVLLRQELSGPAAELLLDALLIGAAVQCGLDRPPESGKAAVWLYSDALPAGRLQPDDAALIMRALALAQAEDQVPAELLASLAVDAARFVETAVLA
jgi:hypothetical protein